MATTIFMSIAVFSLITNCAISIFVLFRKNKNMIDIGVLREINQTISTVNLLIDRVNKHTNHFNTTAENFNLISKTQFEFLSEIKQLKNAVATLQNIHIDSRGEGDDW